MHPHNSLPEQTIIVNIIIIIHQETKTSQRLITTTNLIAMLTSLLPHKQNHTHTHVRACFLSPSRAHNTQHFQSNTGKWPPHTHRQLSLHFPPSRSENTKFTNAFNNTLSGTLSPRSCTSTTSSHTRRTKRHIHRTHTHTPVWQRKTFRVGLPKRTVIVLVLSKTCKTAKTIRCTNCIY